MDEVWRDEAMVSKAIADHNRLMHGVRKDAALVGNLPKELADAGVFRHVAEAERDLRLAADAGVFRHVAEANRMAAEAQRAMAEADTGVFRQWEAELAAVRQLQADAKRYGF